MTRLRFPRVRDVLNKLKHTGQLDSDVALLVRDRMSKTGVKEIFGDQIRRIAKREFDTEESTIPFYKVIIIWKNEEKIWERPE